MQQQQQTAEFGIAEARRVLGEVFAPWVRISNCRSKSSISPRRRAGG